MISKGLSSKIYRLRAEILMPNGEKREVGNTGMFQLVCYYYAAMLAASIMKSCPSIIETTICQNGCRQYKLLGRIQVDESFLRGNADLRGVIVKYSKVSKQGL